AARPAAGLGGPAARAALTALPLDEVLAHLARRDAIGRTEVRIELAQRREAGLEGDISDRHVALEQQRAGADQPHANDEFPDRYAHDVAEEVQRVIKMKTHNTSDVLNAQRFAQ